MGLHFDPCYVFHVMNAFDEGDAVVVDVCRYPSMFDTRPGDTHRHHVVHPPSAGASSPGDPHVKITDLDDRHVEFPRIR